ncbi:type III secretion system protein InvA [Burkholderia ubonensis]|uniref:EscV/YscV/HrcV family type III secretion system export apparatus protein n=1 Tax=Burkholderia ubonensis TaxID=101571 RepID=UPI00075AF1E3|nr:EscV/YscV/HrcV family type III secretion system export apparatus protein [Burkholderia ubonensis]KVN98514.1 type III secretion system protein InvA [Burkholderia ubonensis]
MLRLALVKLQSRQELAVLLLMIAVITMLIIPLPPSVLDLLIGFNIVTALLVFMGSFYITKVLDFSSFPSILLITTLFRLALSISTSRQILLNAEGGKIINSFGQFVIGDNLAVGFVVFAIVTIVQFIVITKGSERVAEVAARFSLDAMPGKQMSIDADLRAGIIDNEGVKARRTALELESQLYGAFDGAMKFVKGDAIAGIVVIFVNLIGGITVGVIQHGMSASDALTTYTILTIGDGLVAQIPALLIAVGAGFVVTRVGAKDTNLGQNIVNELFSNDFVLLVTAAVGLGIGALPGFPLPVFALLALLLGGLYIQRYLARRRTENHRKGRGHAAKHGESVSSAGQSITGGVPALDVDAAIPEAVPLMLLVSEAGKAQFEREQFVDALRRRAFVDMGLRLPQVHVSASPDIAATEVVVLINEIRAASLAVAYDRVKVVGPTEMLEGLGIDAVQLTDATGSESAWVPLDQQGALARLGIQTRPALDDLYAQFLSIVLRNVKEFFGVQETKRLLDDVEKKCPELLKETYRHASVQRVSEVLQRLLSEKISIRNMKLILETVAAWAPKEKDPILLVEHVRVALARYISSRFAVRGKVSALVLSAEFEDAVREGIRQTSTGAFLNLEPGQAEELIDVISVQLGASGYVPRDIVMLASTEVRRFVKRLIESRIPELEVLSFGEIAEGVGVNILKTI